jgi:hypothetical protein
MPKYPPIICMQTLNNPFSSVEKNLEKVRRISSRAFLDEDTKQKNVFIKTTCL